MPYLLWDASALAKRYTQETGSDVVKALFDGVDSSYIVTTIWGYAESFAILWRHHNRGVIRRESFVAATSALRTEIIESDITGVLTIDDATILSSLALVQKHNLNSTDAAILTLFLRFAQCVSESCIVVAADKRLIRSANSEGLQTIDPEILSPTVIPNILATA